MKPKLSFLEWCIVISMITLLTSVAYVTFYTPDIKLNSDKWKCTKIDKIPTKVTILNGEYCAEFIRVKE